MEVTALCIRLLMMVLLLLIVQVDFSYSQKAAFPQVAPNRQQHFQQEPIEVSCEGLKGLTRWRVMKKVKGVIQTCSPDWLTSTGPCKIKNAYQTSDSGEYWCEKGEERSSTVNITVTDGSVILESPVHPVMQGDAVTLCCKNKTTSSNITAEFFKDGHFMESNSTLLSTLTFERVSTSNEGLYKCKISGVESPGSWLTVRVADEESNSSSHHAPLPSLLLWSGLGVLALLLLLLLVGLLTCQKRQTNIRDTTTYSHTSQPSSSPQTVSEGASVAASSDTEVTYAVVTKPRKKEDDESFHQPVYHVLSLRED